MTRFLLAGLLAASVAGAQTITHRLDSLSPSAATAGRGELVLSLKGRFLANNETVSMTCPLGPNTTGCPPIVRLSNTISEVVVRVPAIYFAYSNLTAPITVVVGSFSDSSPLLVTRGFTINPPLVINGNTILPNATEGVPYQFQFGPTSGGTPPVSWNCTSSFTPPPGTAIVPENGVCVLRGTPAKSGTYSLQLSASDSGGGSAIKGYRIQVLPSPVSITTLTVPNGTVGTAYNAQIASTGGSGAHTWSIIGGALPPGLQLSPSTSPTVTLTGTPAAAGNYGFTVGLSTPVGGASRVFAMTVDNPALSMTPPSLPGGQVGVSYSAALTAAGGTGSYSWSIAGGLLPPGLQLSATTGSPVSITGTPTTAGTYNFSVGLTSGQAVISRNYSIVVAAPLLITTTLLPDGVVGSAYNATILSTGGSGTHAWSIADGSLPPGLQLNPSTGPSVNLTGTPTTAGTFGFAVRVTSGRAVTTRVFSVDVTSALTITTPLLPGGVVGTPYGAVITSAGGSGALSWSIADGSLPPGLELTNAVGPSITLGGTPSLAGPYTFVVRVASSQSVATRTYSVVVTAPLSITTPQLPDGAGGSPYSTLISSTGGSGVHSWSIVEGTLPPGLQLSPSTSPSVNLAGTPTVPGTYAFVVRVEASQAAATRAYSVTISATLSITTAALPDAAVNTAYTALINSAGGAGAHTWSIAAGSLPPGVQLAPSTGPSIGLTGTPTASGTFGFRVQVVSAGATATRDLSIAVSGSTLTILTQNLPEAVRNSAYVATVTADGGSGPYLWSIQSGSLPPGITLASSGLTATLSGTPITAGPFIFLIRITGANGESAVRELSLRVNPPTQPQSPMTIGPPTLPSGTIGVVYAAALAVTGGTAPYSWSIASGGPPPGVSLVPSGSAVQLTGGPTTAGTFTFTVRVNDSANQTATQEYSVAISTGVLRILTTALPNGARLSTYAATRIEASGGLPPYRFALTTGLLPAGLSLDTATGGVSGTPVATGTATFAVTVTDSRGTTDSRVFSIVVTETITTLPPAMVGTDYAQRITSPSGSAPFQCSLTAGRIPAGLALSAECDLRGRPLDAGSASMTIEIRDRFSRSQAATYLLNIVPALSLRPDTLESAVVGRDYSATLQAAGGFPPLALSVEGLPAGLNFNPQTGALSGRISNAGNFPFRATVTDSAGNRLARDYTLTAAAGLTITSTSPLPDGELDRDYAFSFSAAGGTAPYSFAADGSLPAGLTLDANGRLRGRPSSPGGLPFGVRVTDSAGATARATFAFFVPMPAGSVETPYSLRMLPPSGNFGAGCQLASGAIPAGVQLASVACSLSSAPSAAGPFEFAVRFNGGNQSVEVRQAGVIQPALRLSPGSLSAGIAGVAYSARFTGDGALSPYTFRVTSGDLPAGLALDQATGLLSGTPSAAGTFRFSVTITDSNARFPATVTSAYSLTLTPPVLSGVRINGPAGAVDPLGQPRISVEIGEPYALPITGRLQLSFTPNADNPSDDPFVSFSNGGRSMPFSVLADRTAATFTIPVAAVQAGTTAGEIRISASLEASGVTITPNPAPEHIIRIARAAPQISFLEVTRAAGALTIRMTGFATPRSVRSARFRFTAGAGATLQTSEFSLPVVDLFNGWYQNRQSTQFGSQFTFTQVFTVQGDASQIRAVEVILSNAEGESAPARREI